ncbi:histidine phosphatase family protein [Clostridium sporogenes]|uniref:histidine phosphatase family protein n=1 Tax=Clostridium sporogenes TaxID=1509 RepID=UPI000E1B1A63|nr:histidine phosphatase family protein [Clostridium sporogenes]MDU1422126.1 histidine phosphatase family protein [Clostridium botulinum]NFM16072.1 histidine phosphatase family protein [Clostridium sporogenes]SUY64580.1 putative phosphoglycerate mutase family protein [Clostridium sporogenes]
MEIGIVRHFKVDYKAKKMMSSSDFEDYNISYDNAAVIENEIDLEYSQWNKCYCSDLTRAIITAKSIYDKELEVTDLLREVKMYPVKKSQLKIPSFLWSIFSRIAWKLNHNSQLETVIFTRKRAKEFLSKLDLNSDKNILIVSHGFFLMTLVNELKLLGFKGDIPKKIKNGYLYILEK